MYTQGDFTWTKRQAATLPPSRQAAAMAYDAQHQQVVLLGGIGATANIADGVAIADALNDTWTWDGTVWTLRLPAASPPPRAGARMAYDPTKQTIVLFGGADRQGLPLNDTWTWDGTSWTQQHPSVSPPARSDMSMAYDAATQTVLLFGGLTRANRTLIYLDDTWAWDGTTWMLVQPSASPSARAGASIASDTSSKTLVLFGGGSGRQWDDTWTWDGATWTLRQPAASPPARAYAQMTYDEGNHIAVLFGGVDKKNLTDTWAWNEATARWTPLQPAVVPAQGQHATMVYDGTRGAIVLFTTIVTRTDIPSELRRRPPVWTAETWTS